MKETPAYARKQWEWVFISQALAEAGLLRDGSRGLGFAVGREPLPSLFASFGVSVLATDAPTDLGTTRLWEQTAQYAADAAVLNERGICSEEQERRLLRFERINMNAIPQNLRDFDFCWSSCALEHLGSLRAGVNFIRRSLDTLKPGGYAIHTTELNVFSNEETVEESPFTVIFRERDLQELRAALEGEGHECLPIDFQYGDTDKDRFIDVAPFYTRKSSYWGRTHLKLLLGDFVTTSVALITRKRG
jgi:SAM-dependent methyltransferase